MLFEDIPFPFYRSRHQVQPSLFPFKVRLEQAFKRIPAVSVIVLEQFAVQVVLSARIYLCAVIQPCMVAAHLCLSGLFIHRFLSAADRISVLFINKPFQFFFVHFKVCNIRISSIITYYASPHRSP